MPSNKSICCNISKLKYFWGSICLWALLLSFSVALAAPSWEIPAEVSQGRAFLIRAYDNKEHFEASLIWRDKTITLNVYQLPEQNLWLGEALLGVPMDARGSMPLTLFWQEQILFAEVRTLGVPWKEQHLTVAPEYVNPPASVQAQIARDSQRNRAALDNIGTDRYWSLPLERPVPGIVTSSFAGRRVFNNTPLSPHTGTDLRGAEGRPILAASTGRVVIAEYQYYSGNVVYVDHGQGVLSVYAHMSEIKVKEGDWVEKGQLLGLVGSTGRVTGPHLHMGFYVQGVAVDVIPMFSYPPRVIGGPSPEGE